MAATEQQLLMQEDAASHWESAIGSLKNPVNHEESPVDIHGQINQRLEADGLNPQCEEGEKLLYLWGLFLQLEDSLKKAQENEEKLKETQAEEMKEVEKYVEHIRQLSDEREELFQELEKENEQLKDELEQIRLKQNDETQKEVSEVLTQRGLGEVAEMKPKEQVAFLLLERARLLEEIENVKVSSSSSENSTETNMQELRATLEQERKDLEHELSQERERASIMKEQLQKEHEGEISALMDENTKLEDDLEEGKKKIIQLEKQIQRITQEFNEEQDVLEDERTELERERDEALKEKKTLADCVAALEKEKEKLQLERDYLQKEKSSWKDSSREGPPTSPAHTRPSSPHRSSSDVALRKVIEDKTKIEGEMIQLRGQLRGLRNEKEAAEEETQKMKKNAEKLQLTVQQLQMKAKNLQQELEETETQLDEAETTAEEAKKAEKEMRQKYQEQQDEVKTLRAKSQQNDTLQEIVNLLSSEKTELSSALDGVRKELQKALAEKEDLNSQNLQLSQTEQHLASQVSSFKEKLTVLERERDDLLAERDDLMDAQSAQDSILSSLRTELGTAQNEKEKLASMYEHLEKENKSLREEMDKAKADLDTLKHTSQELAKQELIVSHLKEQIKGLKKQIAELQLQIEWARKAEQSLIDGQQKSQQAHTDSEKRLVGEIDDLRVTLQHALTELQAAKVSHSEICAEKSLLTEQLSLKESQLHDSLQRKNSLEHSKAELETKTKELKEALLEKSQLLNSYEDERKQRMELEKILLEKSHLADSFEEERKVRLELERNLEEKSRLVDNYEEERQKWQELEESLLEKSRLSDNYDAERKKRLELEQILKQRSETDAGRFEDERKQRLALETRILELNQKHDQELISLQGETQMEKQLRFELEHKVQELEELLDDKDSLLENRNAKITSLESHVQTLQDELFIVQDELTALQEKHQQEASEEKQQPVPDNKVQEQDQLLTSLSSELQKEQQQSHNLKQKVQELDHTLEDREEEMDSLQAKVNSLENQVQQLQDDLFAVHDEKIDLQEKYDKALIEAENAKSRTRKQALQVQTKEQASQAGQGTVIVQELESSLTSAKKQLQETLNELNLANTKISYLEEVYTTTKEELEETKAVVSQKELESSKLRDLEKSVKSLKRDLSESVSSLAVAKSQLKDKQNLLDGVKLEMESLNHEIEYLRKTSVSESEEKIQLHEQLKVMEAKVQQLEQNNAELSKKVSDTLNQREQLSEKLEKEKSRRTDSHHQSARYVEQLEADLNAANKRIRMLREELQQHQSSTFKLEADNLGLSAKYLSQVGHLESELKEVKQQYRHESDSMSSKMAAMTAELRDANRELKEKEQMISDLQHEVSRVQAVRDQLQAQLTSESKTRSDVEYRNVTLEHETTKVWGQVRMLTERNSALESAKKMAEEELERKTSMIRHLENKLSNQESSLQGSIRDWQNRAESAEKLVNQLEQDLSMMDSQAVASEKQLQQAESHHMQLTEKSHHLAAVRNELEGEKLQRTLLEQTVGELKHQVSLLKQRENKVCMENEALKHTIQSLEAQLKDMQTYNENFSMYTFTHKSEPNQQSLMDQITHLQSEVKALQIELATTSSRHTSDLQRYEERKMRTKTKLQKARERYTMEQAKFKEYVERMEDDLRLTRSALQKELEWKEKMDRNYKHLLDEKRDLISQLTDQEEAICEKSRSLTLLQVRTSHLEDENHRLQQRVDSLTTQKQMLDKLVKNLQQNRDEEVEKLDLRQNTRTAFSLSRDGFAIITSDLGNSSDVTWEQDQAEDGSLVFHQGTSFRVPYGRHQATGNQKEQDFLLYHPETSQSCKSHSFDFYQSQQESHHHQDEAKDVVQLYQRKLGNDDIASGEESSDDEFDA